jgi:hypothetical protein
MDMSHDHTDFGAQIPFLGSQELFSPLEPQTVDISHDHTDFGPLIPFLGPRGQFLLF